MWLLRKPIFFKKLVSFPAFFVILSRLNTYERRMEGYLGQEASIRFDQELFNQYKFSLDQLMELAGLSVASAIKTVYGGYMEKPCLVVCGPGNNGGDGLVASRHLAHFGFSNITILLKEPPVKELFKSLLHQAQKNRVKVSYDPTQFNEASSMGVVVDALFGFSFKPPVRKEYEPFVNILYTASAKSIPVASVDIPSGWDVETGPGNTLFMPQMLISLSAPKICSKYFSGPHHFLGGRFVPDELAQKYGLILPQYPGTDQVVRIV